MVLLTELPSSPGSVTSYHQGVGADAEKTLVHSFPANGARPVGKHVHPARAAIEAAVGLQCGLRHGQPFSRFHDCKLPAMEPTDCESVRFPYIFPSDQLLEDYNMFDSHI